VGDYNWKEAIERKRSERDLRTVVFTVQQLTSKSLGANAEPERPVVDPIVAQT